MDHYALRISHVAARLSTKLARLTFGTWQRKIIQMYQWLCLAFFCITLVCQTLRADSQRQMSVPNLERYLGLRSSDPKVCNQRSGVGYPILITVKSAGEWLSAFTTDLIPLERWKLCTRELLSSLPEAQVVLLLDAMALSHQTLLRNSEFERNESLHLKALLLQELFLDRKLSSQKIGAFEEGLAKSLDTEIKSNHFGRQATKIAQEFINKHNGKIIEHGLFDLNHYKVINVGLKLEFSNMYGALVRQAINDNPPNIALYLFRHKGSMRQVVPAIDLKDALLIELEGVAQPVSLCPSVLNTDSQGPVPCVSAKDLVIEHPLALFDSNGNLSLVEKLTTTQFMHLSKSKDGLVLPVRIGGQRLLTLSLGLYFERPPNLVFLGGYEGNDGPTLWVLIDHRDLSRFLMSVVGVGETRRFVLDVLDAPGFKIVSEGAKGADGRVGEGGRSLWSPQCTLGMNGGNGKAGGNGGRIYVSMLCGDANCAHTKMVAQNMILSRGGAGGFGGTGGSCQKGADGAHGSPSLVKFDVIVPGSERDYED